MCLDWSPVSFSFWSSWYCTLTLLSIWMKTGLEKWKMPVMIGKDLASRIEAIFWCFQRQKVLVCNFTFHNIPHLRRNSRWYWFLIPLLCWFLQQFNSWLWPSQILHFFQYDFVHGIDCLFCFAKSSRSQSSSWSPPSGNYFWICNVSYMVCNGIKSKPRM